MHVTFCQLRHNYDITFPRIFQLFSVQKCTWLHFDISKVCWSFLKLAASSFSLSKVVFFKFLFVLFTASVSRQQFLVSSPEPGGVVARFLFEIFVEFFFFFVVSAGGSQVSESSPPIAMDRLKSFFEEKKMDSKFKKAGEGHKLESGRRDSAPADPRSAAGSSASASTAAGASAAARAASAATASSGRASGSAAGSAAAYAAAARQQQQQALTGGTVTGRVFRQTSGEHTPETARASLTEQDQRSNDVEDSDLFPVRLVCAACNDSFSRSVFQEHLAQCLRSGLAREALSTSCCMIWTLTKDKEKIQTCVTTICKYLDNAITHPTEDKFARVRVNNKAFQERVASCPGAREFFLAVGFESKMQGDEGAEEEFLVLKDGVRSDTEHLEMCKEVLTNTEPLKPTLDRCCQVGVQCVYTIEVMHSSDVVA